MSDKSIENVLQDFFRESSKTDWQKVAQYETSGKEPFDFLSWTGKDQILFLPYYNLDDVANLDYLQTFQLPAAKTPSLEMRFWVNLPAIQVTQADTANSIALDHLANGAEGILFDLRNTAKVNANQLFHKIEWNYCFVAFHFRNASPLAELISVIKDKYEAASISGALFWETFPKTDDLKFIFDNCPQLKSLGLTMDQAEPTAEISQALLEGVKLFEAYATGDNAEKVFKSICFSLPVESSFFEVVAKFKALRLLWYQIAQAYSLDDYKATDLHIHARLEPAKDAVSSPESLIARTYSVMSAVLGGCDSITVNDGEGLALMSRLTRNVSNILKEESFFNKVADPLAGAYALDVMVDQIARKSWALFQIKSRPL